MSELLKYNKKLGYCDFLIPACLLTRRGKFKWMNKGKEETHTAIQNPKYWLLRNGLAGIMKEPAQGISILCGAYERLK